MDYREITLRYYSHWIGKEDFLLNEKTGIHLIKTPERDRVQAGYSEQFDLYAWVESERVIISYGEKAAPGMALLQNMPGGDFAADAVARAIAQAYGRAPSHGVKFLYAGEAAQTQPARALNREDVADYLAFFRKANPGCSNTDWVGEYFEEMVAARVCCGVYEQGMLVSCTDAPAMPYMENEVQEIGINTLHDFRGRGHAARAAALCARNIVAGGKCPQWSCAADNMASIRLAEKAGFVKCADVLALTLRC